VGISEARMNRDREGKVPGSPADLPAVAEVLAVAAEAGSEVPEAVALEVRGAVLAGIAGSAEPISATIGALARFMGWPHSN
jgi:hypothetical protein